MRERWFAEGGLSWFCWLCWLSDWGRSWGFVFVIIHFFGSKRRISVIELGAAALEIGGADDGIFIEAASEDSIAASIGDARTNVDDAAGDKAAAPVEIWAERAVAGEICWVDHEIERCGDAITQGAGAKKRQHQIRAGLDAPLREGLAPIGILLGAAEVGGIVGEAADAERGIDEHAVERAEGLFDFSLQEIIEEVSRFTVILIGVADAGSGGFWHGRAIDLSGGIESVFVDILVESVDAAIGGLPWIGFGALEAERLRGGAGGERHGEEQGKERTRIHAAGFACTDGVCKRRMVLTDIKVSLCLYDMEALLDIFRGLADPTRVRILLLLAQMELSVGELAMVLGQSQPRVSRHVRILAEAGLVSRAREGAWVFVRLSTRAGPVMTAVDALADVATLGADDRARLAVVRAERAGTADAWFSAHAEGWDRERSLFSREADVEAAIVAALDTRPLGDLMDVGTGTGRMIELLGPRATSALGIDRSPEMLRLARGRIEAAGLKDAQVRSGDMFALPGADASFDTVVLHQVLHFADNPPAVLAEAARVLRPNGRLLVIDLAAHDREALRTERKHVRLGFAAAQVSGWMETAGLRANVAAHLPAPDALAVTVWLGERVQPAKQAAVVRIVA